MECEGCSAAGAQGHTRAFNKQRLATVFPPAAWMSWCSASKRTDTGDWGERVGVADESDRKRAPSDS